MSQERFDIYFAGELLPNQPVATVRAWLGRQFNLQGKALDHLFSGEAVRIKQDVDMETAGRYRAAFRKAGALVEIRPATADGSPPATAAAVSPASEPEAGEAPELLPPNTGTLEDYAIEVAAAPLPDISDLGLANQAKPLDDTPPPPPADIHTDELDLASQAGPLDDTPPAPPADIRTDHLTAEPPNTGDLSKYAQEKPPQPIPDISKLELDDD